MSLDRRAFIKTSAVGAAGISLAGSLGSSVFAKSKAGMVWSDGMQINPDIDNRRVVCCHDSDMFTSTQQAESANSFQSQNSVVDTDRVENNMDGMAVALSGLPNATDAWARIFRKPSAKQWSEVKAALKVNCIFTGIMPRVAIVGKICKELIRLGVQPSNIVIYDAGHNASGNDKYNPFVGNGLPEGVVIYDKVHDGYDIPVGSGTLKCTAALVQSNGSSITYTNDILVNFAVNKGHGRNYGGYTLTMKNHTGTMKFNHPSSAQEMIDENQSEPVLGGDLPRQQLCVVDSLWAATGGPFDSPTHLPARIVIGTLGPVVDYLVAKRIREDIMNASHNDDILRQFLSAFGYSESDPEWVEVGPYTPLIVKPRGMAGHAKIDFLLENKRFLPAVVSFSVPLPEALRVRITDSRGCLVKEIKSNFNEKITWNGNSSSGKPVKPGLYLVAVSCGSFKKAEKIRVAKR